MRCTQISSFCRGPLQRTPFCRGPIDRAPCDKRSNVASPYLENPLWSSMTISLSNDHARLLRLRSQLLLPQPSNGASNVSQVVQSLCGVQAQEEPAAALAIRARTTGLVAADVEQARIEEIGRAHV